MLTIKRGDDVKLEFTFTDAEGVAVDLTGAEIFFTMKRYSNDAEDVYFKDFAFAGDGTAGILEIDLTADETASFDDVAYSYDVQVKNSVGYILSSSVGKIKVDRDITTRTVMSA